MKEKILKLRAEGMSYKQIRKSLGCSLGNISYHCGEGQKEKTRDRTRKYSKTLNRILKRKKDNFSFINGNRVEKGKRAGLLFSAEEFKKKIADNPVCYLTGRKIDIYSPKSFECDHIVPVSKGGDASLQNLGLLCREANRAKQDLSIEEFLNFCKEVLEYQGYKIGK